MAGEPLQVAYRHRSGTSYTVDGLRSVWEHDVIRDALSVKEALDAGEELGRLDLRGGPDSPRPALVAEALCSTAVASLPFADALQQLQCCVDRTRQEAEMHGEGDGRAFTLLHAAAACRHKEAALLLLAAAPNMAQQRDKQGRTALHWLAMSPFDDAADDPMRPACQLDQLLLAVPGTATAVDSEGRTALFLAAGAAAEAGVGVYVPDLLGILAAAAPATVALPAATGETPVHLAVHGRQAALQALLDAAPGQVAATVTAAAGTQTPLQLAVEKRRWESVAQLLEAVMQAGRSDGRDGAAAAWQLLLEAAHGSAALAASSFFGDTLLHAAAGRPTAALLQLLLSEQVGNVMAASCSGALPLHAAASHGCADAVRLLLEAAPDSATVRDTGGLLPLHVAARSGHAEAVRLLLEAAPQAATAGNSNGWLPLHMAACGGNSAAVQLLLEAAPAKAYSTAGSRRTALMLALIVQQSDAAAILLRHGSTAEVLRPFATHNQHLCADVVAARLPLSAAEWALVPSPCPGLGRALPPALQHSAEQARQLVRRLPAADAERLHVAALALARARRLLRVHLPGPLVGRILSFVLP